MLRFATPEDAPALREIYAQYIDTPITFEYDLPSEQELARRIVETARMYPFLVCEEQGRVAGYACAHRYGERAAYGWNAELSVYLDGQCTSRGMGTRLYRVLMELLALQGVKTVYGVVTVPNEKSEALHRAMGFRHLGTRYSTGYKNGQWHNVALFEKSIAAYDAAPAAVLPIGAVSEEAVRSVLQR